MRPAPVTRQAPSLGDDAVEFGLTEVVPSVDARGDDDGGAPVKAPLLFLVLRSGATVVVFSAQGSPGEHPQIPAEAVSTQITKLEQAG